MIDIKLRVAAHPDIPVVLRFWAGSGITDDRADLVRLLDRDPDALLVAELDSAIVGTVIAGFDGWRCRLARLLVAPEHRRKGIGTTLITAAQQRFVELGGRRADAMVVNENALGRSAWRAAGYHAEEDCRRWVRPLV